ncbi:hypothetical protein OG698_47080 [Streptomyces sp. NBC_01003]|uniref:hypothetical protein n=1 Tax=Streptomyces sp. NBC_01003 TaxID=2903714 RepID=UPI0038652A41|nr:hypothetical protein OG698_47080 [Streptomyces sp. NBC_01003]
MENVIALHFPRAGEEAYAAGLNRRRAIRSAVCWLMDALPFVEFAAASPGGQGEGQLGGGAAAPHPGR